MRLIDADALPKYTGYALSADEIAMAVENAPTIDVAPVRHGHWIYNQDEMSLHCSYCDEVFRFEDSEKDECLDFMEYAKYCLACGTRMDGDEDE